MMFVSVIKNTAATLFSRSGFLGAKSNFKILQCLYTSWDPTLRISRNLEIDKKVLSSGSAFGFFLFAWKACVNKMQDREAASVVNEVKTFQNCRRRICKEKRKIPHCCFFIENEGDLEKSDNSSYFRIISMVVGQAPLIDWNILGRVLSLCNEENEAFC